MDSINRIRSVFDPFGTAKPAAPKKQAPKWIQDAIGPQRAKPNLTPRAPAPWELGSTPVTLGSWLEDGVTRGLGRLVGEREGARLGSKLFSAINDFTPVGGATGMDEGGREVYHGFTRGDLGQMGLGAGIFMLSAGPRPVRAVARNSGLGDFFTRLLRDEAGTFGGIGAKTADLAALSRAEGMAAKGAGRDDIWRDTGWYQGVDGKWRFEIDDSAAKLRRLDEVELKTGSPFSRVVNHPELARAYPDLANTKVKNRYDLSGHGYAGNYQSGEIGIAPSYYNSRPKEKVQKLIGHEMQHGVQDFEQMARGGNVEEFAQWPDAVANDALVLRQFIERAGGADNFQTGLNDFVGAMGRAPDSLAPSVARQYEMEDLQAFVNPRSAYERLAGEVEARNVEKRWGMSAAERRATPPWATQDVADEDQIIRFR